MTKREMVLSALHAALVSALSAAVVKRNIIVPQRVPAGGLVILRDGSMGEGEPILSPLSWYYEHRAGVEVLVDAATEAARDTALDVLLSAIGTALAVDRTLGGVCDWCQAGPPDVLEIQVEGGAPLRGASLDITLVYVSADPLA